MQSSYLTREQRVLTVGVVAEALRQQTPTQEASKALAMHWHLTLAKRAHLDVQQPAVSRRHA